MENGVYIALSRQMVLQNDMTVVANNVANMSTPGFRGQNLMFSEYISDPKKTDDPLSFVFDHGQYQVTDPGPVQQTNNSLDVALEGPGFIGVKGPGGEPAYTRAGNFQIGLDGVLTNAAGFPIASAKGETITIPENSTEISIDEKGFISNQDGELGRIRIAEFDNLQNLNPLGNNLYALGEDEDGNLPAPREAENTRVLQGHLEGSNVQPVVEMTRMIEILRAHQGVEKVIQGENERLRSAIQRLTKTS